MLSPEAHHKIFGVPQFLQDKLILFLMTMIARYPVMPGPGKIAHHHLLWPESAELQTVYEEDFGRCVADLTCLNVHDRRLCDLGGKLELYISPRAESKGARA